MSDEHRDAGASRGRPRVAALRLGGLIGVLVALILFVTLDGPLRGGSRTPTASLCSGARGAPQLRQVHPREQAALREDVARAVPQRVARLYEEGAVNAQSAWTDEEPAPPPVAPSRARPGAYEMRWWAPNGDDVVADVFVFPSTSSARRFASMASSARCRRKAARAVPPNPPQAVNLSWLNPDGAAQADVFLQRGLRVYRIADAPAGQRSGGVRPSSLRHAFLTIDTLACLLPGVRCGPGGANAVPA